MVSFGSDDYDEIKNTQNDHFKYGESDDDDEDEDDIVPDTRQIMNIEPSPVFIPDQFDTDHLHRHQRRDESILNMAKGTINSTPVEVNYINKYA